MEKLTDTTSVLEMGNFCSTDSRERGVEISLKVLGAERAAESRQIVSSLLDSFMENMSEDSLGLISAVAAVKEVQDSLCGDRKKQTHCVKMKMWRLWSDLATVMLQQDEEEAALNDKEMAWHHEYQDIVISLVQKLQDSQRHNSDLKERILSATMENVQLKERIRLLTEEVANNEEKKKEAMDEEKIRQHYERSSETWCEKYKALKEEMEEKIVKKRSLKEEGLPFWDSWNTEKEVVDAELKRPTKKVRARGSVKQELPQHAGAIEDGGVEMEVLEREECRCSDGAVRTQCPT